MGYEYKYENPLDLGYERIKIKRSDQNRILKNRQCSWKYNSEFYLKDETILLHQIPSVPACLASTLLFPLMVVLDGVSNFKDVYRVAVLHPWQSKKYGAFSTDAIHKRGDGTFDEPIKVKG